MQLHLCETETSTPQRLFSHISQTSGGRFPLVSLIETAFTLDQIFDGDDGYGRISARTALGPRWLARWQGEARFGFSVD
jgi:hypothetical protein